MTAVGLEEMGVSPIRENVRLTSTHDYIKILYSTKKVEITFSINISQKVHNFISTHLLTVLIISVILHIEQRKGNKKKGSSSKNNIFGTSLRDVLKMITYSKHNN